MVVDTVEECGDVELLNSCTTLRIPRDLREEERERDNNGRKRRRTSVKRKAESKGKASRLPCQKLRRQIVIWAKG